MQIAGSTRSLWEMSFPAACGQLQDLGFDKAELWINDDFGQLTTAEVIQSTESVVAAFRVGLTIFFSNAEELEKRRFL